MKSVDVAVIGGGILGCFAARNLMRWNLSVVLIEKELDICTGITRANSAIVYAGYDNKTGSQKVEMPLLMICAVKWKFPFPAAAPCW